MAEETPGPRPRLSMIDAVSIMVGIVIGAGIYETTPLIASQVSSMWQLMAVWLAGGCFALLGAMCYAELATAWPHEGGDFAYLERAFGRGAAFFFGWTAAWIVRPGAIGAMAFVFARYAQQIFPLKPMFAADGQGAMITPHVVYAGTAIVVTSLVNVAGINPGRWFQNLLTLAKVLGLLAVFTAALLAPKRSVRSSETLAAVESELRAGVVAMDEKLASGEVLPSTPAPPATNIGLAMILVLFTYGGWNEMAFVAAEVKDPGKNLVRSLLWGTLLVMGVYLLINAAFLWSLGLERMQTSQAVAVDALGGFGGTWVGSLVAALVCVSALGAIHGQVFTGARMFYALGKQYFVYRPLGKWNARLGTPTRALLVQAIAALFFIVWLGRDDQGFEKLNVLSGAPVWMVMLLVALSLFALRQRGDAPTGSFRVPGYPVTPLLFAAMSLYMLYACMRHAADNYAGQILWPLTIVAGIGIVLSAVTKDA